MFEEQTQLLDPVSGLLSIYYNILNMFYIDIDQKYHDTIIDCSMARAWAEAEAEAEAGVFLPPLRSRDVVSRASDSP